MTSATTVGPPVAATSASPPRTGAPPAADARLDASTPQATDPQRPASRLDGTGAHLGDEDAGADAGPPFADLLVPQPPVPPPATAPAPNGDGQTSTGPSHPAAPGQLLALLDGYRLDAVVRGANGAPAQPVLASVSPSRSTSTSVQDMMLDADGFAAIVPMLASSESVRPEPAATLAAGTVPSTWGTAAASQAAAAGGQASSTQLAAALEASGPGPVTGLPLAAVTALPETDAALPEPPPAPGITGAAPEASTLAAPTPSAVARAAQPAPALPPLSLPAQPADGFDDGFGGRIAWMAGQRLGHAEIRLNPEHLGVIDVRLQLDGDQVRAEFNSASTEVRQAIEASLPRLRELLGQHGLQLGQADVGQRQPGGDDAAARTAAGQPDTGRTSGASETGGKTDAPAPASLRTRGLVDEYA